MTEIKHQMAMTIMTDGEVELVVYRFGFVPGDDDLHDILGESYGYEVLGEKSGSDCTEWLASLGFKLVRRGPQPEFGGSVTYWDLEPL